MKSSTSSPLDASSLAPPPSAPGPHEVDVVLKTPRQKLRDANRRLTELGIRCDHLARERDRAVTAYNKRTAQLRQAQARAATLFDAIAHGDDAHRARLKLAIERHFSGQAVTWEAIDHELGLWEKTS